MANPPTEINHKSPDKAEEDLPLSSSISSSSASRGVDGGGSGGGSGHAKREPTEFEQRVYDTVRRIPPGFVASYGLIAQELKTSARGVGGAMKRNPFAPEVP